MGLPFTSHRLLAPMDGVTDVSFRSLVLSLHGPEDLGGAFTEFVRITGDPISVRCLKRHLGPERFAMPVGLQLMGNHVDAMAETARRAEFAGAAVVDLNFGCPAKGASRTCAGSALLDDPPRIERLVRACTDAVERVPVTAKIRSGVSDDRRIEEIARAAEQGGARLLTIHCRTRDEKYREEAIDWSRIERAVNAVSIPVCGNGGIVERDGTETMRRRTGCAYVMVGRAALADPWMFSGERVSAGRAAAFLLRYRDAMMHFGRCRPRKSAARVKQLLRYWTAGDLVESDRLAWLREQDPARLFARLEAIATTEAGATR